MKKLKPESRKLYRETIKWHNEKFDKLCGIKKVNGKLKLFTPEAKETINLKPEITYKMKKVINSVKKAILHLNILGLLFIVACGSDNPTGSNNPPVTNNDSLVKSVDSLALYVNGLNTNDTNLYNIFSNGDSIKVSFTAETDCSTNDTAFISGSVGNISFNLDKSVLPNSFTYYGSFNAPNGIGFLLYLKTTSMRYLRMKNIKLYKVNPV